MKEQKQTTFKRKACKIGTSLWVTIPAAIVKELEIKKGDNLLIEIQKAEPEKKNLLQKIKNFVIE